MHHVDFIKNARSKACHFLAVTRERRCSWRGVPHYDLLRVQRGG